MRTQPSSQEARAETETLDFKELVNVLTAFKNGDFSVRMSVDRTGLAGKASDLLNEVIEQNERLCNELTRISVVVGKEGQTAERATLGNASRGWKQCTDAVNTMVIDLMQPTTEVARVIGSVANGDLSQTMVLEIDGRPLTGEFLRMARTVNTMVAQLGAFASEVTRVAREVGTEGKLGGQAEVRGVSGTWKDLTDNVNLMANNLTGQVRNIAEVTTAVARGDLSKKITADARGEILELKSTINTMVDQLNSFASEVTRVAREVGTEGKLGGQAQVRGVSGTWKDLTDNVNRLAANLTTQVRAIAEVATAVTTGDLSRSITLDVEGEIAALKDNINEMIRNLRDTTRINTEQDWLKTNVARFTRLLQGQRDLLTVSRLILSELAPLVSEQAGVFYITESPGNESEAVLKLLASYGYQERKHLSNRFRPGEGLVGQCMLEKQRILLTDVPEDYIQINSGLGQARPSTIVVLPILFEGEVLAVMELASFHRFSNVHLTFLDQLTESIGIVLNTLAANMRTEELLKQSQTLTQELQNQQEELQETNRRLEQQATSLQASEELLRQQQEELQQTNEELEEKAELLSEQNREVERKNRQIELARQELEEKAEQLALTSKYKSEFLANMSHELRTPLNSMLILSRLLSENPEGNLTGKQVEYATTIHSSGNDLLALINEILDLAKIESGTMEVEITEVPFVALQDYVVRNFREIAQDKGLEFGVTLDANLPNAIFTDTQRLQQVLRNLLSNALKFTEQGRVALHMQRATEGWSHENNLLNRADAVIAFAVIDTGIGIPLHRQRMVFEAFQQGDGTTSRKYGGTGLGLSISREIASLLGGEIKLESVPGEGSIFTLYLPHKYIPGTEEQDPASQSAGRSGLPGRTTASPVRRQTSATGVLTSAVASTESPEEAEQGKEFEPDTPQFPSYLTAAEFADDRSTIRPGDQVLLIVEDDPTFGRILLDLVREKNFKGIITSTGESVAAMVRQYHPDAITLDIRLPDMDGWAVLDRLKHDPETRHIPVHIISGTEGGRQRGLKQGAIAYLPKPATREDIGAALANIRGFVERKEKRLLVVEDDETQRSSIVELIGNGDVKTVAVSNGEEALSALKAQPFDCMVIDLGLPDMTGFQLIERVRKEASAEVPIIIYTAKELTKKQETELRRLADSIIVKDVRSPERLLDETTLFLHRVQANLPALQRKMLEQVRLVDPVLVGKKVLIVDDDIRNIFALTSLLEHHHMEVVYAETGKDAIATLQNTSGIDIVLMDVMMPEMDGYETMRAIRKNPKLKNVPIIALTAKAMRGDRDNSIDAGASDYISKPVDNEQLLSLLRVWLYR